MSKQGKYIAKVKELMTLEKYVVKSQGTSEHREYISKIKEQMTLEKYIVRVKERMSQGNTLILLNTRN
jgi:hypothetical protein